MNNIFAELSRRKVIRVAAAYGIVSWIILQVIGLVAPNIGLPAWTVGFVLVLLLAGLPIAMIFTWGFEITPEGVKRTKHADGEPGPTNRLDLSLLTILVFVGAFSIFAVATREPSDTQEQEITESPDNVEPVQALPSRLAIAVLPFADMSPEGDQGWFSDGISEEIIHRLVQQKQLTVAGRTSSFYFKNKNVPFEEIGRILNVGTVLEGSVRKFENRIRITAQLIDVESGAHIWSGTFDRELKDIFRIQDDLSVAIATTLLQELGITPSVPDTGAYEPNLAAYEARMRGEELALVNTSEAIDKAIMWFRKSAVLDPNYARPVMNLIYIAANYQGPGGLVLPSHHLDIDELLVDLQNREIGVETNLLMKAVIARGRFQFREADRYFRLTREVEPDDEDVNKVYGQFLAMTGRPEEALTIQKELLSRNPLSRDIRTGIMLSYRAAGRWEDLVRFHEGSIALGVRSSVMDRIAQGPAPGWAIRLFLHR